MSDDDPIYCRTCRTALTVHTAHGVVMHYSHARMEYGADHAADPVPISAIPNPLTFCDFCGVENPAFFYPTANVARSEYVGGQLTRSLGEYWDKHNAARTTQSKVGATNFTQNMGENWLACIGCASYIDQRDLLGLIWRVTEIMPKRFTRGKKLVEIRGRLTDVYGELFATLGERRPNPALDVEAVREATLRHNQATHEGRLYPLKDIDG